MGLYTTEHPDVHAGSLSEFGFHKVQRQTKSIIISMLNKFFSVRSKAYGVVIPEIIEMQNSPQKTRVHNKRDFPSEERKFPMIVTSIRSARERKAYIGADDLLYVNVAENSDGTKIGTEIYAGMADIDLMLIIVATSPEERMKLAEMVYFCFTHFYRGQFIYKDETDGMYSIVPATKSLDFGVESEITDESKTTLVYVTDLAISAFIEYHFLDIATGDKLYEVNTIEVEDGSGVIEN